MLEDDVSDVTVTAAKGLDTISGQEIREFDYAKLDHKNEIRLFQMLPDDEADPDRLNATLIHASLECPPDEYIAISYCWGDPTRTHRLWLNKTQYLPITAAAAHVLGHVIPEKYLWMDAVCINQQDVEEKTWQVRIMWGIYRQAEFVAAWLGGLEEDVDLALQLIYDVKHVNTTEIVTGRKAVWLPMPDGKPMIGELDLCSPPWVALRKLLCRPWFRRLWTIQEMVAAKEIWITCGNESLKWDDLTAMIKELDSFNQIHILSLDEQSFTQHLSLSHGVDRIRQIEKLRQGLKHGRRNTM